MRELAKDKGEVGVDCGGLCVEEHRVRTFPKDGSEESVDCGAFRL